MNAVGFLVEVSGWERVRLLGVRKGNLCILLDPRKECWMRVRKAILSPGPGRSRSLGRPHGSRLGSVGRTAQQERTTEHSVGALSTKL